MGALRALMPVTAGTFIVGWLAIAGVPPFSGFWSKDEILLYAYDKSPILWALGLVTALLTAYYMTRQVVMVFFGEARWKEARPDGEDHVVHPHESPALMLVPLVVLAGLAIVGGLMQLPFGNDLHFLGRWLEPVVEEGEHHLSAATEDIQWILALVAVAAALVGLALGWMVYERKRVKAIEPTVLARGWYYDQTVTAFMGGPGREAFDAVAWTDTHVVDGAVNGTGRLVRASAGRLRRLQTGNVRTYAVGVGLGAVALLAWFVIRGLV
jgi:NADH-quinone oxidoreductase subunit L